MTKVSVSVTTTYTMIDPNNLTMDDMPLVVMADNLRSLLGLAIRKHGKGNYSHIMRMLKPGSFVSQEAVLPPKRSLCEVPLTRYVGDKFRLKFWKLLIKQPELGRLYKRTEADLEKPWYNNRYDFLGIFGQAINCRWIQSPFANFCSENIAQVLKDIGFMEDIPLKTSPSALDKYFSTSNKVKLLGYYFTDRS